MEAYEIGTISSWTDRSENIIQNYVQKSEGKIYQAVLVKKIRY
jgi:hypothetical protein